MGNRRLYQGISCSIPSLAEPHHQEEQVECSHSGRMDMPHWDNTIRLPHDIQRAIGNFIGQVAPSTASDCYLIGKRNQAFSRQRSPFERRDLMIIPNRPATHSDCMRSAGKLNPKTLALKLALQA